MMGTKVLDQFFLPPESNMRFRLLIGLAMSYILALSSLIGYVTHRQVIFDVFQEGRALEARLIPPVATSAGLSQPPAMSKLKPWAPELLGFTRTLIPAIVSIIVLPPLVIGTLSLFAWLLYRLFPTIRIRAAGLRRANLPAVEDEVKFLSQAYGVPCPTLLQSSIIGGKDVTVFGTHSKHFLCLRGDWSSVGGTGRAMILHELAHIKNRDSAQLYGSLATFMVFIAGIASAVLALSRAMATLDEHARPAAISQYGLIRFLIVALCAFLITLAVVRRRELLADWRAGRAIPAKLLTDLLSRPPRRWWTNILSAHPDDAERTRAIESPDLLNRTTSSTFLMSGLMWGILTPAAGIFWIVCILLGIVITEKLFWTNIQAANPDLSTIPFFVARALGMTAVMFSTLVPLTVLGAFLHGTLGLQAQRQIIAAFAGRCPKPPLLRWAFVTVLGFEMGFQLSLVGGSILGPFPVMPIIVWIHVATLAIWLWLVWLRELTRLIFGAAAELKLKRSRRWISTILSTSVAVMVLLPVLYWRVTLATGNLFHKVASEDAASLFTTTAPVLFVIAMIGYLLACLILVMLTIWSHFQVRRCHCCSHVTENGLLLHRRCVLCGAELTPWVYAATFDMTPSREIHIR